MVITLPECLCVFRKHKHQKQKHRILKKTIEMVTMQLLPGEIALFVVNDILTRALGCKDLQSKIQVNEKWKQLKHYSFFGFYSIFFFSKWNFDFCNLVEKHFYWNVALNTNRLIGLPIKWIKRDDLLGNKVQEILVHLIEFHVLTSVDTFNFLMQIKSVQCKTMECSFNETSVLPQCCKFKTL